MINNILGPDEGSITINGQIASPRTQKMIGYMPEERGLYKNESRRAIALSNSA